MSEKFPSCVKTRLGEGCAELFFSIAFFRKMLSVESTPTSTKSRWKFYTQLGHRSFHTAYSMNRHDLLDHIIGAGQQRQD
jgi:hypothetical protein